MKMEVEVISREIVKPSSPAPQDLRHYHLSFIDQITPQINNAMVYFFDTETSNLSNINDANDLLKKSLSQVLTHYYPLAGRVVNRNLVDCNDEGVPYFEARVRCHVSHVVDNPSPAEISKLVPYDMDEIVDTLLGVQFNVFDCGGIAVGVCISHKVVDALAYFQFIKSWAAMARGEPEQIRTHFQSSTHFPPKDLSGFDPNSYIVKNKVVEKRFVFEASAIESLRTKYSKKTKNILEDQKPPSRVEVLSNFLWTRFIAATNEEGSKKIHMMVCSVNLRPRMEPPLPEYAFGNYYWTVRAFPTLDESDDLRRQLREEINKVDNDFIMKLREMKEWNPKQIMREETGTSFGEGEMVLFTVTSLCRFPVYEVDFGWGNPTWAGPPEWKFKNVVALKDTKSGGGIEAYVSLMVEDMAKFEHDKEFLSYVSTTGLN